MVTVTGFLPAVADTQADQRALVAAAAVRDTEAFAELYGQYSCKVYNLILRSVRNAETAEDVAQEVWIKAYRDLPKLRDPLAFASWIYQMASKTCIDAARRRARTPGTAELSPDIQSSETDPESAALGGHDAQLTREALAALPPHQHVALFMREVDDRSYREISEAIGISETAVGLCLMRARRSFGKAYSRLDRAGQHERCQSMQPTLARVFDGEATPLQRTAAEGHLASCKTCRADVELMREGSKRYAMLALAPVPAVVNAKVFAALGLGAATAGGTAVGLAGSLLAKLKLLLFALLTGAGVTTGVAVVPGARPMVLNAVANTRNVPGIDHFIGGSSSNVGSSPAPPVTDSTADDDQPPAPAVNAVQPSAPVNPLQAATAALHTAATVVVPRLPVAVATFVAPVVHGGQAAPVTMPDQPPDVPPAPPPGGALPGIPLPELPLPSVSGGGVGLP